MLNQKMTKKALAILGAALICSVGALADQPAGIAGNVTVQNGVNNPVPVVIQGVDDANPVPVSVPTTTHMGQAPQEHVSLVTGSGTSLTCPAGQLSAIRRLPNGDTPIEEFVVPEGKMLVLTDFAIGLREKDGNDWIEGNNLISIRLGIGPSGAYPGDIMWQTSVQIDGHMATSEEAWVTEKLTSGVVIGPGQRVCLRAGFSFSATENTVSLINLSKLYGYLVDI